MTVKELIEALQKCPQERPVYIQTYDGSTYDMRGSLGFGVIVLPLFANEGLGPIKKYWC